VGNDTGCAEQEYCGIQTSEYLAIPYKSFMSFNWYISVCTTYTPVYTSIYQVYQKNSEDTVLRLLTVGNETMCAGHVGGGA